MGGFLEKAGQDRGGWESLLLLLLPELLLLLELFLSLLRGMGKSSSGNPPSAGMPSKMEASPPKMPEGMEGKGMAPNASPGFSVSRCLLLSRSCPSRCGHMRNHCFSVTLSPPPSLALRKDTDSETLIEHCGLAFKAAFTLSGNSIRAVADCGDADLVLSNDGTACAL